MGISKLVSILQEFTIKSKDQNFQAFCILGFFLPFLLYILLAETQDKKQWETKPSRLQWLKKKEIS